MDARLQRLFERHGARYVLGGFVGLVAFCVVVLVVIVALPATYEESGASGYLLAVAIIVAGVPLLAAVALAVLRRPTRDLLAWSRGARDPALAARADQWAYELPRRFSNLALGLAALTLAPAITLAVVLPSDRQDAADVLGIAIGIWGTVFATWVTARMAFELLLRPVRTSLDEHARPNVPQWQLTTAVGLLMLTIVFLVGGGGGYLFTDHTAGDTNILVIWGVSLAITSIAAMAIALTMGAIAGSLRSLVGAHRNVGEGELPLIPVVGADELGELTESFNTMVGGLRERERLERHNVELVDELRASRTRIVAAGDESRRLVERDLHDGAQQNLVLLNLKLGILERKLAETENAALVAELRAELERALAELRDLAHGIYPQVLTSDGLGAALAEVAPNAVVEADGLGRHAPELEAAVYFCCLEALQNAAKYAGEGVSVRVGLSDAGGVLRFEIADDGAGFDPAAVNGSMGLQNISDRIRALGGEVEIESSPGAGTAVRGTVPLEA